MDIKIFGERNTGTRAIVRIVRNNSKSIVYAKKQVEYFGNYRYLIAFAKFIKLKKTYIDNIIGHIYSKKDLVWQWKHCATNFETLGELKNVHFIFMVRDPLSWLHSFHKNPYEQLVEIPEKFGEFIHCEWKTSGRERMNKQVISPIKLYEAKLLHYRKFMRLLEDNGITYSIIRFEDLIRDQESEYQKIQPFLNSPNQYFEEFTESTKENSKNLDYYKNYYNNGLWRNEIPFEVRKNFHFNTELMDWLKYDARYYIDV